MNTAAKKPPIIFILSAPCSGSFLLSKMLNRHPQLVAPAELHLLPFDTLQQRKSALSAPHNKRWQKAIVQTIMDIKQCPADQAQALLQAWEAQNLTMLHCYQQMQQWLGDQILIDSTTKYAAELETLKRAENLFEQPYYINLVRHPYGMIHLFETAKFDQFYAPDMLERDKHTFSRREFAELIWLISYQNILDHLANVPKHRQHRLKFEDLVRRPQLILKEICQFLGLSFHPHILESPEAEIRTEAIQSWQKHYLVDFLSNMTWHVAELLEYRRISD